MIMADIHKHNIYRKQDSTSSPIAAKLQRMFYPFSTLCGYPYSGPPELCCSVRSCTSDHDCSTPNTRIVTFCPRGEMPWLRSPAHSPPRMTQARLSAVAVPPRDPPCACREPARSSQPVLGASARPSACVSQCGECQCCWRNKKYPRGPLPQKPSASPNTRICAKNTRRAAAADASAAAAQESTDGEGAG